SRDNVVICGAGIIGSAIAYYLAEKGVKATVVEKGDVACASSGKAGGFLALDWNDSTAVGPLARLSYVLHKELAQSLGADTGYREVRTYSVKSLQSVWPEGSVCAGRRKAARKDGLDWLDGNISQVREMAEEGTTAQVHPEKLTRAFLDSALSRGAKLVHRTVQGIALSVRLDGEMLPAGRVVIAMGPWSGDAARWLPGLPRISGQKAHSILVRPSRPVGADCLFAQVVSSSGQRKEPEVYPRPDGSVYICGESDDSRLPDDPLAITPRGDAMTALQEAGGVISSALAEGTLEAQQACFLPTSPDGLPVLGRIPGIDGAYIASGHSCWGILNAPATGKAMAELVADGAAKCVSLAAFDPARFLR
ncbi:D-amino acid oxidase, partial [Coccomyxa subellipsoidea C-169]